MECTGKQDCMCDAHLEAEARENELARAGEKIAGQVSDYVNPMQTSFKYFVDGMSRQHRTLQQKFTGLCMAWLAHLATLEPGQYDGRNAASVALARCIRAAIIDREINTYLPTI
jgi:hypothetical protein